MNGAIFLFSAAAYNLMPLTFRKKSKPAKRREEKEITSHGAIRRQGDTSLVWASFNDHRFSDFITVDRKETYLTSQENESFMLRNKVKRHNGGVRRLRTDRNKKMAKKGANMNETSKSSNKNEQNNKKSGVIRRRPAVRESRDITKQMAALSLEGIEEEAELFAPKFYNDEDNSYGSFFRPRFTLSSSQLRRELEKRRDNPTASPPLRIPNIISWNCLGF